MWIADGVEDIRYLFKKKGQHMRNVYIDFETYSPEPIKTLGCTGTRSTPISKSC